MVLRGRHWTSTTESKRCRVCINIYILINNDVTRCFYLDCFTDSNRPYAPSGHMVRNKLCWDANNAVGLPARKGNCYYSSPTLLCFESPTALSASQHNLFRTMSPDPAKRILLPTAMGHFRPFCLKTTLREKPLSNMKMSSPYRFSFMQIKLNLIRKVSQEDSFWNRGRWELRNGLLYEFKAADNSFQLFASLVL